MSNTILVVDDDKDIVEFLSTYLRSTGRQVACAFDGESALQRANDYNPKLVLLDINIPMQDGWLVCSKLKLLKSSPKIIFITGETRHDLEQFVDFVHADALLRKPFGVEDVQRVIDEIEMDVRASA